MPHATQLGSSGSATPQTWALATGPCCLLCLPAAPKPKLLCTALLVRPKFSVSGRWTPALLSRLIFKVAEPEDEVQWGDPLTICQIHVVCLPFFTFAHMLPAAWVPHPFHPSLSSGFSLSFKVYLRCHVLQEAFLDMLVLRYVPKFFDTSLFKR